MPTPADQFTGGLTEETAIDLIDEGEDATSVKTADDLGLVLHHRPIALLAGTQGLGLAPGVGDVPMGHQAADTVETTRLQAETKVAATAPAGILQREQRPFAGEDGADALHRRVGALALTADGEVIQAHMCVVVRRSGWIPMSPPKPPPGRVDREDASPPVEQGRMGGHGVQQRLDRYLEDTPASGRGFLNHA